MPQFAGREVGPIGFGLLGFTWRPTPTPQARAFATMSAALDAGCTLWNGGEFYGPPDNNSLTLLRQYYESNPDAADKVVLNIKGATEPGLNPNGSEKYVKKSVDNCLKLLGPRGKIDMFECARRDPKVPLKETLGALEEYVKAGKIGGIAMSEVSAATIREAAAITKIVAVEIELSLWNLAPLHNGIAEACAELGIPIHAYSPLGKGFLTGQFKSFEDLPDKDIRKLLPRFQPGNFDTNLKLVRALEAIAQKKSCTPAQLAIGWLCALSKQPNMPEIFPIPGATSVERVQENGKLVELKDEEMAEIDSILEACEVVGDRYHPMGMALIDG